MSSAEPDVRAREGVPSASVPVAPIVLIEGFPGLPWTSAAIGPDDLRFSSMVRNDLTGFIYLIDARETVGGESRQALAIRRQHQAGNAISHSLRINGVLYLSNARQTEIDLGAADRGLQLGFDIPFQFERHGSPFVAHTRLVGWFLRPVDPPAPTHGPGVFASGRPVLWDSSIFHDVSGKRVSRDAPEVVSWLWEAAHGHLPLPILPGFANLLPTEPGVFRSSASGAIVQGALCSSLFEPGGFTVLDQADLAAIMGYPHYPRGWSEMRDLLPVPVARSLLLYAVRIGRQLQSPV